MPWYEPVATPPLPPCFRGHTGRGDATQHGDDAHIFLREEGNDVRAANGRRGRRQQLSQGRDRVGGQSVDDEADEWGEDELQRRLEALISPMISSSELSMEMNRAVGAAGGLISNSATGLHGSYQPPYPHPSFRHRERQPATPLPSGSSDTAYFFHPKSLRGRQKTCDSKRRTEESTLSANTTHDVGRPSHERPARDMSSLQKRGGDVENGDCGTLCVENLGNLHLPHQNVRNRAGMIDLGKATDTGYPALRLDDGAETGPNPFANSRYGTAVGRNSGMSRSRQMNLAQDPNSGNIYATPPPERRAGSDQSWEQVGQIGVYGGQQPDVNEADAERRIRRSKKGERSKKKKSKRDKKSDAVENQDILASLSGETSTKDASSLRGCANDKNDFEGGNRAKAKNKGKRRSRDREETEKYPVPDRIVAVEEMSFEGIDECEFMNAGQSDESLDYFLNEVKSRTHVAWTMIFFDDSCTNPFLPMSKKYCTEKGPKCVMWNCTCDRQIRAKQASAPLLGAMFSVPNTTPRVEGDGENCGDPDCYILPLGPTMTSDGISSEIEKSFDRMKHWPVSPFQCETSLSRRWNTFRQILMDKSVTCVTFNAVVGLLPFHFHRAHDVYVDEEGAEGQLDLLVPGLWDLRLASWLLLPHSTDEELEIEKVRDGFPHLIENLPKRRQPNTVSKQLMGLIVARENIELLLELYPIIDQRISDKGIRSSFDDIESPLQPVLSAMECMGIGFLPSRLLSIDQQLEGKINQLTEEARSIAKDSTFLLSSPQQVSHLLFDIMKIEVPKGLSTKQVAGSKHRSTSEEALKAIQAEAKKKGNTHPIVDILLKFRTLNKMLTTYIRPLPNFAQEPCFSSARKKKRQKKGQSDDKAHIMRIHPMWMQTAVRTGRLSCRKPNMQQVPTDSVLGVNPRDSFRASSSGKCLFACDYSQNEIRILAHMSSDNSLIKMFHSKEEVDIYKQMASACSGKLIEAVTDEERRIYKQVTLAILYGMGIPQVAKKLGVSKQMAQNFFESFFGRFQGVRRWIEATKEFARRHHYVKTVSGRRRYLDEISSTDSEKRARAERQAVNTVIQGSAADLMKLAMLKMSSRIMDWKKEGSEHGGSGAPPKILLQIHDELLFEITTSESDVKRLRDSVMRCCGEECVQELKFQVPLKLKCSYGISWGSMKEMN